MPEADDEDEQQDGTQGDDGPEDTLDCAAILIGTVEDGGRVNFARLVVDKITLIEKASNKTRIGVKSVDVFALLQLSITIRIFVRPENRGLR